MTDLTVRPSTTLTASNPILNSPLNRPQSARDPGIASTSGAETSSPVVPSRPAPPALAGLPPRTGSTPATAANLAPRANANLPAAEAAPSLVAQSLQFAQAVGGHLVHQTVAVGLSTAARELLIEGVRVGVLKGSDVAAFSAQLGLALGNVVAQVMRRAREARDPDAAAMGALGISSQAWEAMPESEKAGKRRTVQLCSKCIMQAQVAASLVNGVLGMVALATGNKDLAGIALTNEFKGLAYAGMRETAQASFNMVDAGPDAQAITGRPLISAAVNFTVLNTASNFAGTALAERVGPMDLAARNTLAGLESPTSMHEAVTRLLMNVGLRASLNVAVETADWTVLTGIEGAQAGTRQRLNPQLTGTDYGRLLDQAPSRAALISSVTVLGAATAAIAAQIPGITPAAVGHLSNTAASALAGAAYMPALINWQASGAVRAAAGRPTAEPAAQAVPAQPGAAHVAIDIPTVSVHSSVHGSTQTSAQASTPSGLSAHSAPNAAANPAPGSPESQVAASDLSSLSPVGTPVSNGSEPNWAFNPVASQGSMSGLSMLAPDTPSVQSAPTSPFSSQALASPASLASLPVTDPFGLAVEAQPFGPAAAFSAAAPSNAGEAQAGTNSSASSAALSDNTMAAGSTGHAFPEVSAADTRGMPLPSISDPEAVRSGGNPVLSLDNPDTSGDLSFHSARSSISQR